MIKKKLCELYVKSFADFAVKINSKSKNKKNPISKLEMGLKITSVMSCKTQAFLTNI